MLCEAFVFFFFFSHHRGRFAMMVYSSLVPPPHPSRLFADPAVYELGRVISCSLSGHGNELVQKTPTPPSPWLYLRRPSRTKRR